MKDVVVTRTLVLVGALAAAGLSSPAANAQPPGTAELHELIVLLRAGDEHPSVERLVEDVNQRRPLREGLGEGNPLAAKPVLRRRARGAFGEWLRVHSDHPRARLERAVTMAYPSPVNVAAIAEALRKNPHVEHVELNRLLTLSSTLGTDPLLAPGPDPARYQWGAHALRLPAALSWLHGHIPIGVIDRGIMTTHEDLRQFHEEAGTLVFDRGPYKAHVGRDVLHNDCVVDELDPDDGVIVTRAGHGDHVSGILAGTGFNGVGVTGSCPRCTLHVMKAFRADTNQGAMDNAAEALTVLVDQGVSVVNMSFGIDQEPCTVAQTNLTVFCQAIDNARRRDVVLVAASGNNRSGVEFPANSPDVIAVGGVAFDDQAPESYSFWDDCPTGNAADPSCNCLFGSTTTECGSNFGPELSVSAPAKPIVSTMYVGWDHNTIIDCGDSFFPELQGYGPCAGSSMSTAFVSGTAGLDRSANPNLDRDEVRDALESTASRAGVHDNETGFGVPDAEASVRRSLGTVFGQTPVNRLVPFFCFYSPIDQTHACTTSPTMASSLIFDVDAPFHSVGPAVGGYDAFPDADCVISPCDTVPRASLFVFTTHRSPVPGSPPLVPVYQVRYDPNLPFRCDDPKPPHIPNRDFAYTTSDEGVLHFKQNLQDANGISYELDGIVGYIFGRCEPEPDCIPEGAERVYRLYHPERDDYAIFPESELLQWQAAGYISQGGVLSDWIGYSYVNVDSDGDFVIDGWETAIGTDPDRVDSDCDGLSDGVELLVYDMSGDPAEHGFGDPIIGPCSGIFSDGFEPGDASRWSAAQ